MTTYAGTTAPGRLGSRSLRPAVPATNLITNATRPRSTAMYLIYETLARARMRRPQSTRSEASRSARRIAMSSLREQDRRLSTW